MAFRLKKLIITVAEEIVFIIYEYLTFINKATVFRDIIGVHFHTAIFTLEHFYLISISSNRQAQFNNSK